MSSDPTPPVPSPTPPSPAPPELRLHPLSFLFALIGQLKQFALPLLVLVFTGRSNAFDAGDVAGLVGVGVLALVSIAQYFTYRYRIDADGVVIRSGLLQRSLRHIPFSRIQNVTLHQGLLHRLFGVAEVRLESAGAAKPEGQMRVLRLDAAQALERQVRGVRRAVPMAAAPVAGDGIAEGNADAGAGRLLLRLSTGDVIRHGLVSNRGLWLLGGGMAVLAQAGDNLLGKVFEAIARWFTGQASALHLSIVAAVAAALFLALLGLVLLRLLSVVLALLQFHGFELREADGRLAVTRGLATRLRASLPAHRIQAWTVHEGLLHRLLERRSLRVDTAVVESAGETRSIRDLVPIGTPAMIDALVDSLLPTRAWPVRAWQPLHPRAWLRIALPSLALLALAGVVLAFAWSPWGLLLLVLAPLRAWQARHWAAHSAWSVADGLVAFRHGWIERDWRFAEVAKLQAIEFAQSPLDRRFGMAGLRFDTAGAGAFEPGLGIPCLPEETARAIYAQLSGALAGRRPGAPFTRSRIAGSAAPGS